MLPARIRFAFPTAIALFVLVLALPGQSPRTAVEQPPAQPKQERKLQDLLQERLATARELAKQNIVRFKTAQATIDEVLEPTRLVHEAALDLCKSDKERVQVLSDYLQAAQENERIALRFEKAGQGRQATTLRAKVERLRVEIALARAKARAAAKAGAGANVNPLQPNDANKERICTLPLTIEAFESVQMFAHVAGFLKRQTVDIGDRVKRGQVLAVLDVPELEKQLLIDRAAMDQARARVMSAKSRVKIAEAELQAGISTVKQAEAAAKSAAAFVRFRETQYKRMKELRAKNSIEERLLAESQDRFESAVDAEKAAKAAIETAKAHVVTGQAKVEQVKAELVGTEADVRVAEAKLEKSQVFLAFATITAPFDGVITQRNFFPGDFIRSASNPANSQPLLTVQRTDRLRAVVLVPERDALHLDVGDAASVEIDAIPGKKHLAKVSRISGALDPKTRLMRAELDLANPTGRIRTGMYGRVSIRIESKK